MVLIKMKQTAEAFIGKVSLTAWIGRINRLYSQIHSTKLQCEPNFCDAKQVKRHAGSQNKVKLVVRQTKLAVESALNQISM